MVYDTTAGRFTWRNGGGNFLELVETSLLSYWMVADFVAVLGLAATSDTGNNTTASSTTNNSSATASPVTPTDIASISMGNIATSAADISDSPLENVSTMNSTNDDYPSSVDDSAPTQISTDNSGESDLNDDGDSGDSEDSNEGPTSTAQDTPTDSNDGLTSVSQDSPAPTYSVVTVTLVSATEVAVSRSRLGSDGSKNHSATAAIQTITATSLDPKSNSTTNATESFLATIPDSCQSFCVDYPYAVEVRVAPLFLRSEIT